MLGSEEVEAPSFDNWVEQTFSKITSSSLKDRVSSIETLKSVLEEEPGEYLTDVIIPLIFYTENYEDRKSRVSVEKLITILTTEKFRETFIPEFLKLLDKNLKKLGIDKTNQALSKSKNIFYNYLRWINLVISHTPIENIKPEFGKKIINIQNNLLNLIEAQFSEEQFRGKQTSNQKLHRYSLTKSAFSSFSSTIQSSKELFQLYQSLVFANPKTIDFDSRILVGIFANILFNPKHNVDSNLRGSIIELYVRLILSSPTPVSIAVQSLYDNLIKSLTKDEFVRMIPDTSRTIPKSSKVSLPIVFNLVSNLSIPLENSFIQPLIDSFLLPLKSDDQNVRSNAIKVLQVIYDKSKSELVSKLLIGLASDRNSSPVTKEFCAKSLATFKANPMSLLPLYKAPGSEKLKSDALAAIGVWYGEESAMAKDVIDILEQLLKQAKMRRVALQCLAPALRSVEIQKQLASAKLFNLLISEILQKDFKTQPYKIDYLLAIYSCSLIAQHNPALVKQLEGHQVWEKVFSKDSFLWSHEFFFNLSEVDALAVLDFCEVAVRFQKYAADPNNCLFVVISYLLTFSNRICKPTVQFIKNIAQLEGISTYLLKGFFSLTEYLLQHNLTLPKRMITSLINIVCNVKLPGEFFGPVLMIISHSQLTASKARINIWRKIQKLSGFELTKENNDEAVKYFAHNIFYSPIQSIREASIHALVLLSKIGGDIKEGIAQLISTLRSADLLHLTEEEVALYYSPEGELFDKSILGTEYESRSSGKKKDDDDDDYAPSKPSQPARGSGGKQRGGRGGAQGGKQPSKSGPTKEELLQKAVEQQLIVETERRNVIKDRVGVGKSVLSVLSIMSDIHPSAILTFLPRVIDEIFGLIVHPILQEDASQCLEKMGKCIALSNLGPLCAILLNKLLSKKEEYLFTTSETVGNVIARLERISTNNLIPTPAFFFVYPIIHEAIINPPSFKLQEAALSVIERHNQPDIEYPRPKMIESLLYLIDSHPVLNGKALKILITVCEGVRDFVPQLFNGLFSSNEQIRNASLQGLFVSPFLQDYSKANLYVVSCLMYARNDPVEGNRDWANRVWGASSYQVPDDLSELLKLLESTQPLIQQTASNAIAQAVGSVCEFNDNNEFAEVTLEALLKLYTSYLPPPPRMTIRGMEYSKDEMPHARVGVAKAISSFSSCISFNDLPKLFQFLLENGPLTDADEEVRQAMIEAGNAMIDRHGAEAKGILLPLFEKSFECTPSGGAGNLLRESLIIFMGRIACNFEAGSPKVLSIANSLIESISTPSSRVQNAIAECLMVLSKSILDQIPAFIESLFTMMEKSSEDHISRGSAHAIAGILKGIGVPYLKKLEIVTKLNTLIENKNPNCRVGALFCFECLSKRFGRAFEPYVVLESVLNKLLKCFGDSSISVREATASTSKVIMSQLSPHGVKKIAPALVKSLSDNSWRTKKAAVDLLGSMAFCSPKHLSSCLPEIVPPLVNVLSYTHAEVQKSTKEALGHISSVIRNPEIQGHSQIILKALVDPVTFTEDALDQLIRTNFVHVIDSPSLALIIPIIERGLRERKTAVKKNAAQIVGNMTTLAAHSDLEPYLGTLIPSLKTTLCDVIPETRYVSARALGYMVKGLGEEKFPDLLPWLFDQLRSDESTVVRSGAAQGLSQVFAALDIRRFENMFPQLLAFAKSDKANVREGVIGLFVFAPSTLNKDLEKYLPKILPLILEGLSDEAESVREISMRAGQAVVAQYALSSMGILLPSLEDGLFHPNWRIRQSSIQLLGDLLFNIAGEDAEGSRRISPEVLEKNIGSEKYKGILAALYMIRSDVTPAVRQQALIVWKSFVQNTPKTLKEILPTLLQSIIISIGSPNEDRRHVGSKTLGEITKKLGDQIIPTIIPILRKDLSSDNSGTRQGVCLGLSEVLQSAPKYQMTAYLDDIIAAVRKALCDEDQDVREAAALTFDTLFSSIGTRVIDETLPTLLNDMRGGDENAINGLKEILNVRSKVILPHLIPQLLAPPLSESNCLALVSVCEVSGKALYRSLHQIIDTLIPEIASNEYAKKAASAAVVSVKEDGLHYISGELLDYIKSEEYAVRLAAAFLIEQLFSHSSADLSSIISPFMHTLILTLNDPNPDVLLQTVKAIDALVKSIPEDQRTYFVNDMRRCIHSAREHLPPNHTLPGLCLPGGVDPIVTIFLQGLRTGSPDIRENSAKGLTDAINLMSNEALAPTIKQITGALIRVMGDRFIASVKAAIMQTINVILIKGGQSCKFFAIQLQTICTKALTDESKEVRNYAVENIGELTKINPRIDSLITELLNSSANPDVAIQESILKTLSKVLRNASAPLTDKITQSVEDKMSKLLTSQSPSEIKKIAARVYGSTISLDRLPLLLKAIPSFSDFCGSIILSVALQRIANSIKPDDHSSISKIASFIDSFLRSQDVNVKQEGFNIMLTIIKDQRDIWQTTIENVLPIMIDLIKDPTVNIKISALQTIKKFAKLNPLAVTNYFNILIPLLMERIKDRTSLPVKQEAERTLLYVSQTKRDPQILLSFAKNLDPVQKNAIVDYYNRILSKMEESDEEDE